jgi:DNA polymerase-1
MAPPLVCVTWQSPGEAAGIEHHSAVYPRLREWLEKKRLVGQNVAYDMAVVAARFPSLIPAIFHAYEEDRVTDTMIRAWLIDTAAGSYQRKVGHRRRGYSLEDLAPRFAGIQMQKDEWRTSYSHFLDAPLSGWVDKAKDVQAVARVQLAALEADADPKDKTLQKRLQGIREMVASRPEQCLKYPIDDAVATLAVHQAQEKHAKYLLDQYRQAQAYWALHLSSVWGMRTDETGVSVLRLETQAGLEELEALLKEAGLVKPDGVRDTKATKARMIDACTARGIDIPRTDGHDDCELGDDCREHVCLDAESCEESEDPILISYAKLSELKKVLTNDVEALAGGIIYPVHTRYGFAATGRTTSSRPNIQNVRRLPGIRDTYVPRPGKLFAEADYPQLELYTLAQCCLEWLGESLLAKVLNEGLDPHLWVAAIILNISYDEALKNKKRPDVKNARQLAKCANFGFSGGLGIKTFIDFAKSSMSKADFLELGLTEEVARRLKHHWFEAYPEMPKYFDRVNRLMGSNGRAHVETLYTQRHRGNATYCAACNNGFQALGSDCAKRAAFMIAKEQYVDTSSFLFGTRTVAFVHDEFILEVDDNACAHDAAYRLAQVMVDAANKYLPDVPIPMSKMEPVLMRRWSKNAVSVFDSNRRLVAWQEAA